MEVVAEAKLVLETAGVAAVTATAQHPRIAVHPATYHGKTAISKPRAFFIRAPLILLISQLYVTGYFLGT